MTKVHFLGQCRCSILCHDCGSENMAIWDNEDVLCHNCGGENTPPGNNGDVLS